MNDRAKQHEDVQCPPEVDAGGEHSDSLHIYMRQLAAMPEFSYEEQSASLKRTADALDKLRNMLVRLGFVQLEYLNTLADCDENNMFDYFIPSSLKKHRNKDDFLKEELPEWQQQISDIHKRYLEQFSESKDDSLEAESARIFGKYPVIADLLQKWYDAAAKINSQFKALNDDDQALFLEQKVLMRKSRYLDFFKGSLDPAYKELNNAKDIVLESNLRLVIGLARSFNSRGMQLNDLIQEGNLGLIRAIEKYDYHLGHKFSTYASWWIKQTIGRAISEQSRVIRIPVHMIQTISKINKAEQRLIQLNGREPQIEEIAEETTFSKAKVSAIRKMARQAISLQTPVNNEDGTSSLEDFLSSNDNDPASPIAERTVLEKLHEVIGTLSEREQIILKMRFGLDGGSPKTLVEVSNHFNLTRERIRQLEQRIFEKLRSPARLKFFDGHFHIN